MKRTVYKTVFIALIGVLSICNYTQLVAQDLVFLKVTSPDGIDWDIDATHQQVTGADGWGPQLTEDLSGEIVKAFDGVTIPSDNDTWTEFGAYVCDSIVNPDEIAGKIAYISRGACAFCTKTYNAQKAGAIGVIIANRAPIGLDAGTHEAGLITMVGDLPECDSVTIPTIFITHEDRIELEQMLDAGPVMGTFAVPAMYDFAGPAAYATPIDQVQPLDDIKFSTFTRMGDTLYNVEFTVTIEDPNSDLAIFTETVDTLLAGKDWNTGDVNEPLVELDTSYTPSMLGTYTMTLTAATQQGDHQLDSEIVTKSFEVTDHTFALDNDEIVDTNGIQTNTAALIAASGVYDVGSIYRIGSNGGTATHASFAVANPGALDLGLGYDFTIKLYNADADDDGLVDTDFTEEVASVVYSLEGSVMPNQLIDVAFEDSVDLDEGIYCLMVEAGGFAFSDQAVAWTTAGGENYPSQNTVYRFGTALEIDGYEYWNGTPATGPPTYALGGRHPVVRLQMAGYEPPVGLKILPESNVEVYPTLVNNEVTVDFDLDNLSKKVLMIVTDVNGRFYFYETKANVKDQTYSIDVSNYPPGPYFITFRTDDSAVTKKIMVMR